MGKINYTLLNASVLNASRLNMTGETGKPGGGAGGYWPDGTPAAIRRSAVLWYDIAKQGATNETMAANPVLKDLSGHGHDATCYNFGWGGMSGVGGYVANFSEGYTQYVTVIERTYKIIHCTTPGTNCWPWHYHANAFPVKPFSAKVSGLNGQILRYYYYDGTIRKNIEITSDGVYDFPESILTDSEGVYCGFYMPANGQSLNVTIEQLPEYPGALVSDGVDDYAVVEGIPNINSLLIDYDTMPTTGVGWQYLYDSKLDGPNEDRWYYVLNNEGNPSVAPPVVNGYAEKDSSLVGNRTFALFKNRNTDDDFGKMVLRSLLLFSRKLTSEEIEWVKNNLIKNNTEA